MLGPSAWRSRRRRAISGGGELSDAETCSGRRCQEASVPQHRSILSCSHDSVLGGQSWGRQSGEGSERSDGHCVECLGGVYPASAVSGLGARAEDHCHHSWGSSWRAWLRLCRPPEWCRTFSASPLLLCRQRRKWRLIIKTCQFLDDPRAIGGVGLSSTDVHPASTTA